MNDCRNELRGLKPMFTRHALQQMVTKDFEVADAVEVFNHPHRVYPSGSHADQLRVTGRGMCLVGKVEGDQFIIITIYLDEVVTSVRPDQMLTPEGQMFAQRGRRN